MSEEISAGSVVYYELRDTITQLRRENEIMKKALEKIACFENTEFEDEKHLHHYGLENLAFMMSSYVWHAREALKDCEEPK